MRVLCCCKPSHHIFKNNSKKYAGTQVARLRKWHVKCRSTRRVAQDRRPGGNYEELCVYIVTYIYIYICIERERDVIHIICIYIYIYTYIYIYIYVERKICVYIYIYIQNGVSSIISIHEECAMDQRARKRGCGVVCCSTSEWTNTSTL